MVEVLLFSFSISIDAFGYAMGFGSRNIKVGKLQFLLINLINSLILTFFMLLYKTIKIFNNYSTFLEKMSAILLFIFGIYYVLKAYFEVIKDLKNKYANKNNGFVRQNSFLNYSDILLLFGIFVFENIFSTIIFYSCFQNAILFVVSNFLFHYSFFILGFDFGNKIIKKVNLNSSFLSGFIFLILSYINYFELA